MMASLPNSRYTMTPTLRDRLRAAADEVRRADDLAPDVRDHLAELLGELDRALAPSAEVEELAESTLHLADSLVHKRDQGLLAKTRDRVGDLLVHAEADAPIAV